MWTYSNSECDKTAWQANIVGCDNNADTQTKTNKNETESKSKKMGRRQDQSTDRTSIYITHFSISAATEEPRADIKAAI